MVTKKYALYDSDFDSVLENKTDWEWGDQDLDLEPELSLKADFLAPLVEHVVNGLGWYGRRISMPYRFFGFLLVSREEQIRSAMLDPVRFKVPFGREMNALAGPPVFGLGDDGDEHNLQRDIMLKVIDPDDPAWMGDISHKMVQALMENGQGSLDAVDDVLKPVLAETCFEWYGLKKVDPRAFLAWSNAISNLIFATPTGASDIAQRRAFEGARRLRGLISQTLADPKSIPSKSILGRLLLLKKDNVQLGDNQQAARDVLTEERIISLLVGMISGSAPTTLIAAAYALRALLSRSKRMQLAQDAARTGQVDKMRQIVRECFRLRPATWPGVFRRVSLTGAQEQKFAGRALRHQESVVLAVASGLRDEKTWRRPAKFNPERMSGEAGISGPAPDLAFGIGGHDCVGRWVAEEITVQTFMALFSHADVQKAGRMRSRGAFPATLPITYQSAKQAAGQEMRVAVIPGVTEHLEKEMFASEFAEARANEETEIGRKLRKGELHRLRGTIQKRVQKQVDDQVFDKVVTALKKLNGNPADGDLRKRLTDSGLVHTHSVSVISVTREGARRPHLAIEFNLDGPFERALPVLDAHVGQYFGPVFEALGYPGQRLSDLLVKFDATPSPSLFGHSGVGFNGVPEWTVSDIEVEQQIADIAEKTIDEFVAGLHAESANEGGDENTQSNSARIMNLVRTEIQKKKELAPLLVRASSNGPAFAKHEDRTFQQAIGLWMRTPAVVLPAVLTFVAFLFLGWCLAQQAGASGMWLTLLATVFLGAASMVLVLGSVSAFLWWQARRLLAQEAKDLVDNRYVPLEHNLNAAQHEDAPGIQQNHFIAVNTLKSGFNRRVVLAFGFYLISRQVMHWFRPGFVVDLGTIRHARWLKVKGSQELVFQASFDGSWERYLEDFSDKVSQGQTLIWGNCEGFPRTYGFTEGGAYDAERFKRWVRGRQVPTLVWYSRFDGVTNDRIRRNALIRDGLSRTLTREQSDRWLRLFGSNPISDPDVLETEQIQSVVLGGFGKHPSSVCLGLRVNHPEQAKESLRKLMSPQNQKALADGLAPLQVSFGPTWSLSQNAACTLGITAGGLLRLGVPQSGSDKFEHPRDFPLSFVKGMGRQARVLGDNEKKSANWIDVDPHATDASIDIVIIIAAKTEEERTLYKARLRQIVEPSMSVMVDLGTELPKMYREADKDRQFHGMRGLGFLDGVGQPRVIGTPGISPSHPAGIQPGEFILGYRDERGLIGPSPSVPASWDQFGDLPDAGAREKRKWPDFTRPPSAARDLGRNGSYLVLRQLSFDAEAFNQEVEGKGEPFPKDWLAEKIVGRRRDGKTIGSPPSTGSTKKTTPCCPMGHQSPDATSEAEIPGVPEPDVPVVEKMPDLSGLTYAFDDPTGDRTPLGSHVRRANPRDSLDGGAQQAPGRNRHRILRRGRSYTSLEHSGLLFGCLNASIERQFEFVQQTWLNSTSFHGLWGESDPLLTSKSKQTFSIPTANGRVKVELEKPLIEFHGGGYFFLPGKAALTAITRPRASRD